MNPPPEIGNALETGLGRSRSGGFEVMAAVAQATLKMFANLLTADKFPLPPVRRFCKSPGVAIVLPQGREMQFPATKREQSGRLLYSGRWHILQAS